MLKGVKKHSAAKKFDDKTKVLLQMKPRCQGCCHGEDFVIELHVPARLAAVTQDIK